MGRATTVLFAVLIPPVGSGGTEAGSVPGICPLPRSRRECQGHGEGRVGAEPVGGRPATGGGGWGGTGERGRLGSHGPQSSPTFWGGSFRCAGGSGFPLFLVRTSPDLGGSKGHRGGSMNSTQTRHICGCRSNTAEHALSSLLPSKNYPCSPCRGAPTCLGAAILVEAPQPPPKRLFICSQMPTGRGICICLLYPYNLQGHL